MWGRGDGWREARQNNCLWGRGGRGEDGSRVDVQHARGSRLVVGRRRWGRVPISCEVGRHGDPYAVSRCRGLASCFLVRRKTDLRHTPHVGECWGGWGVDGFVAGVIGGGVDWPVERARGRAASSR